MHVDNALAWEVWSSLDEFDRPFAVGLTTIPRPISSLVMAEMTEGMGGTREDFERVKLIERLMYPAVQRQYAKK